MLADESGQGNINKQTLRYKTLVTSIRKYTSFRQKQPTKCTPANAMLDMCRIFHKTLDIMENGREDNTTPGDNCMNAISTPRHLQCFSSKSLLKIERSRLF